MIAAPLNDSECVSAEGPEETLTFTSEVDTILPVLREEIFIDKRLVTTGTVLIRKVVHQREELVDEPLLNTSIEIVRVPVNRVVSGPLAVRSEGDVTIYPVVEEVVFVTKQFVLKEEIRVTRRTSEVHRPQSVTLLAEELVVDRGAPAGGTEAGFGAFQEGSIELTESAEEVAVSKHARVVEELVIGKEISEHRQTVRETVRRTDVTIEQIGLGHEL